jgi:hypothetical protein
MSSSISYTARGRNHSSACLDLESKNSRICLSISPLSRNFRFSSSNFEHLLLNSLYFCFDSSTSSCRPAILSVLNSKSSLNISNSTFEASLPSDGKEDSSCVRALWTIPLNCWMLVTGNVGVMDSRLAVDNWRNGVSSVVWNIMIILIHRRLKAGDGSYLYRC